MVVVGRVVAGLLGWIVVEGCWVVVSQRKPGRGGLNVRGISFWLENKTEVVLSW